jgi:hypothetical protein
MTPPQTPNNSSGRNWSAVVSPRATPLPVSLSTNQPWATICIQVPVSDTS